ncbi:MAG: sigma-70 family RNA polymerase sigma factor [Candidatus Omnitrophica bacterium]|nr:sigma-70 family RNA polymerase sigma factor [Candidatus Omnitrophota bacterium]
MEYAHDKDDSDLIERCISKDASAWGALLGKYSGLIKDAIYNRARKYGVSLPLHDIEDIMQDVLTAMWKGDKLSTIKNRKDISCWLAIVSGNAAAQYLSDRDSTETLNEEETAYAGTPPDEETLSEIEKAIEKLPPKERLIIQLHLFYNKKYREIADMLDIPEGTVSSYIKRSKSRLKKMLRFLQ